MASKDTDDSTVDLARQRMYSHQRAELAKRRKQFEVTRSQFGSYRTSDCGNSSTGPGKSLEKHLLDDPCSDEEELSDMYRGLNLNALGEPNKEKPWPLNQIKLPPEDKVWKKINLTDAKNEGPSPTRVLSSESTPGSTSMMGKKEQVESGPVKSTCCRFNKNHLVSVDELCQHERHCRDNPEYDCWHDFLIKFRIADNESADDDDTASTVDSSLGGCDSDADSRIGAPRCDWYWEDSSDDDGAKDGEEDEDDSDDWTKGAKHPTFDYMQNRWNPIGPVKTYPPGLTVKQRVAFDQWNSEWRQKYVKPERIIPIQRQTVRLLNPLPLPEILKKSAPESVLKVSAKWCPPSGSNEKPGMSGASTK